MIEQEFRVTARPAAARPHGPGPETEPQEGDRRVGNALERRRGLAFVRRIYPMRNLGVALLALPVLSVLAERHAGWPFWALVGLNVLVWPHLARWRGLRAADPARAERANLVLDAVFGCGWIAATAVSIVPTAALLGILSADRLAAGGWRLVARALGAGAVAFVLVWWLLGWPFAPTTSTRSMLLALPAIMLYPLALSHVIYRLAQQIGRQGHELDRLSLTDPGVDLPNRRFFNAQAAEQIARARASGAPAVLLVIDVDRFKAINDRHGHRAGDAVLEEISRKLRGLAGISGFPARIGGDEFALLVSGPLMLGEKLAAQLQQAVVAMTWSRWPGLQVSVSIGVSALCDHHRGLDDWLGAADRAMYVAKASGRPRAEGGNSRKPG